MHAHRLLGMIMNEILVLSAGIPQFHARLVFQLQSVPCAASRQAYRLLRSARITDALVCLDWLRTSERIGYKITKLSHQILLGNAPRQVGPFVLAHDRLIYVPLVRRPSIT